MSSNMWRINLAILKYVSISSLQFHFTWIISVNRVSLVKDYYSLFKKLIYMKSYMPALFKIAKNWIGNRQDVF